MAVSSGRIEHVTFRQRLDMELREDFDRIYTNFENISTGFDKIRDNFTNITRSFDVVSDRINGVNTKVDNLGARLDARMDNLDARMDNLDAKVDNLEAGMDAKFNVLDAKVDNLGARLDARIDNLGARLDARIDTVDSKFDSKFNELKDEVIELKVQVQQSAAASYNARLQNPLFPFRLPPTYRDGRLVFPTRSPRNSKAFFSLKSPSASQLELLVYLVEFYDVQDYTTWAIDNDDDDDNGDSDAESGRSLSPRDATMKYPERAVESLALLFGLQEANFALLSAAAVASKPASSAQEAAQVQREQSASSKPGDGTTTNPFSEATRQRVEAMLRGGT